VTEEPAADEGTGKKPPLDESADQGPQDEEFIKMVVRNETKAIVKDIDKLRL